MPRDRAGCLWAWDGELWVTGSIWGEANVTSKAFSVALCLYASTAVQGGCWEFWPGPGVAGWLGLAGPSGLGPQDWAAAE